MRANGLAIPCTVSRPRHPVRFEGRSTERESARCLLLGYSAKLRLALVNVLVQSACHAARVVWAMQHATAQWRLHRGGGVRRRGMTSAICGRYWWPRWRVKVDGKRASQISAQTRIKMCAMRVPHIEVVIITGLHTCLLSCICTCSSLYRGLKERVESWI